MMRLIFLICFTLMSYSYSEDNLVIYRKGEVIATAKLLYPYGIKTNLETKEKLEPLFWKYGFTGQWIATSSKDERFSNEVESGESYVYSHRFMPDWETGEIHEIQEIDLSSLSGSDLVLRIKEKKDNILSGDVIESTELGTSKIATFTLSKSGASCDASNNRYGYYSYENFYESFNLIEKKESVKKRELMLLEKHRNPSFEHVDNPKFNLMLKTLTKDELDFIKSIAPNESSSFLYIRNKLPCYKKSRYSLLKKLSEKGLMSGLELIDELLKISTFTEIDDDEFSVEVNQKLLEDLFNKNNISYNSKHRYSNPFQINYGLSDVGIHLQKYMQTKIDF